MSELHFRIKGFSRDDLLRRRQPGQQHSTSRRRFGGNLSNGARFLLYLSLAVGLLYTIQWVTGVAKPSVTSGRTLSVMVEGKLVTAKKIIVLVDTSNSMSEPPRPTKLNQLINSFNIAGMSAERVDVEGFGFGKTLIVPDYPSELELALVSRPDADAIFVFSDFDDQDAQFDQKVAPAYARLRDLLQQRRRRIYLGTVNTNPPAALVRIAREFGGDVVVAKEGH